MLNTKDLYSQCNGSYKRDYAFDKEPIDAKKFKELELLKNELSFYDSENIDTIPVQVNFVRNNDGSGQLATLNEILEDVDSLNKYYEAINLYFQVCPVENHIDNDLLYNLQIPSDLSSLIDSNENPRAINIYYVNDIELEESKALAFGMGLGYLYEGVIVEYSLVGDGIVLVHEFGHVFHLTHTHGKYSWDTTDCDYENWTDTIIPAEVWCMGAVQFDYNDTTDLNNDGIPDSWQTGDDIADTPAEPCLYYDSLLNGCEYIGTVTDYYGDTLNPVVGNFMSYGPCKDHFTNDQYIYMRMIFEELGLKLLCNGCNDYDSKTVVNNNNAGKGSLRWGIECANCSRTPTTINFEIPDSMENRITLESKLPYLRKSMHINALSQGDVITLDGSNLLNDNDFGFYFYSGNIEISGFKLFNFPASAFRNYYGYDNISIYNCEIDSNQFYGIYMKDASNISIYNNIIQNTAYSSVYFNNCEGSIIYSNQIASSLYYGIHVKKSNDITIGGEDENMGNTIIQNGYYGIRIADSCQNIKVFNNYIGTDVNNTLGIGNLDDGMVVQNSQNIHIGGAEMGNVISGNGSDGIVVYDTSQNVYITANKIGLGKNDFDSIPNQRSGIKVRASSNVTIGGENDNEANHIAYNETSIDIRDQSEYCYIKQNSSFCSEWAVYVQDSSNQDIEAPVIDNIPDEFTIQGTSEENAEIWVYKSDTNCSSCEGRLFLGKTNTYGNNWQLNLNERIYNGDIITAMASVSMNSSEFAECYIAFSLPSNIAENVSSQFRIYPNPANDFIHIHQVEACANTLISIYNMQGQEVCFCEANSIDFKIDISALSSGYYLLQIINNKQMYSKPFAVF